MLSHVACGWVGLEKSRRKWTLDFSFELLRLAVFYRSPDLTAAYARCCYELMERSNAARILDEAIGAGEVWLATMAFQRISEDVDGVLSAQGTTGGGGDFKKSLERFLTKVL